MKLDATGGNVQIRVDKKKYGVNHEVAQKVSMSGAKARRFLQRASSKLPKFPTSSTSTRKWELWKDLCSSTTSEGSDPNVALLQAKVWVDSNSVVRLMSLQITGEDQRQQLSEAIRNFTTSFVNAWGEVNVVHYIVSNQTTFASLVIFIVLLSLFETSCSWCLAYEQVWLT